MNALESQFNLLILRRIAENESGQMQIQLNGEEILLLPERALFWEKEKCLFLSDLHLGKSGHFRKHGIAVSPQILYRDLDLLAGLINRYHPERVMILGDLFHSTYNAEWEVVGDFFSEIPLSFELVPGNHDILHKEHYLDCGLRLREEGHQVGPFRLYHEPEHIDQNKGFALAGHIHPGIRMQGGGRQSLRFPCFHFTEAYGILPAFGQFTGLVIVYPKPSDEVYAIVESDVIKVL